MCCDRLFRKIPVFFLQIFVGMSPVKGGREATANTRKIERICRYTYNLHANILSLIEMRSILRFLYYVLSTCYFFVYFSFQIYIDCTNSLLRFKLNLGGAGREGT